MKFFTTTFLFLAMFSQANAGISSRPGDAGIVSSVYGWTASGSTAGCIQEGEDALCIFRVTGAMTVISSSSLFAFKEDMKQVEQDAFNFLAGEKITFALEIQMNELRHKIPETESFTDQEMATLIIEIANS